MGPERSAKRIADEGELLTLVREAWRDTLGVETRDDDTGFFDAGGDSLLLLALVESLNEASGLRLRTLDLYRAATIRGQANLLLGLRGDIAEGLTQGN